MLTSEVPSEPSETTTDSTGNGTSKGALWIAIGAFLVLVLLILTNMK